MLSPPFHNALVLTGPTASGKTGLGIEIAQRLGAEIVSMDSMTLYRGMDIGTAKPTPAERIEVRHHLIDVLDPWESASVAWWLGGAQRCCQEIESRGKRVLFVGGTPLYLKALICGLFAGPPADESIRRRLTQEADALGSSVLHDRLAQIDTVSAGRIHSNDVRRIIRALEVHELTGKPISAWQTQWPTKASQQSEVRKQPDEGLTPTSSAPSLPAACCPLPAVLWLDLPREQLYQRIDLRVERMFAGGLIEEARRLRASERPLSPEASKALGYAEVFDLLDGRIGLKDAIVRVQARSRNLAKRQITWFRHLPDCRPATIELTRTVWKYKIDQADLAPP